MRHDPATQRTTPGRGRGQWRATIAKGRDPPKEQQVKGWTPGRGAAWEEGGAIHIPPLYYLQFTPVQHAPPAQAG